MGLLIGFLGGVFGGLVGLGGGTVMIPPMVLATAVPTTSGPSRLSTPTMATAGPGRPARVTTRAEMALEESWNPLVTSKAKATTTARINATRPACHLADGPTRGTPGARGGQGSPSSIFSVHAGAMWRRLSGTHLAITAGDHPCGDRARS